MLFNFFYLFFSANCDKNSSNYSEKGDREGRDSHQKVEEKTEVVEELGSHGHLCKCGSNSEICEDFINSFSLQDILSNFELPLSSSTDDDDETSSNKKQNEDEEELNLIDFLNNTQFLNDFVNKNSIKLDKVCRNVDSVDLVTKNNRKKKSIVEEKSNHQILHDNQYNVYDNQFINSDFGNQADNHGKDLGGEQEECFVNEESSSELSVQSEDSQSNSCAKYSFTSQDIACSFPLPSFDTFKSKNINSQFLNEEDNIANIKENTRITPDKCMEMFHRYQNDNEQLPPPKRDDISADHRQTQSIMGININEQINEFERYTEEQSVLEQLTSHNNDNVDLLPPPAEIEKNSERSENFICKRGSQKGKIDNNVSFTGNLEVVNELQTSEKDVTEGKTKNENPTQCMMDINSSKTSTSRPVIKQFEEVIDSGNFWVGKNNTTNNNTNEGTSKECILTIPNKKENFRVPIANNFNNKFLYETEREADENVRKSVKILTKTHLLNSMQFDKNQRHFINSPQFLLLLTKPLKSPIIEGQCFTKNLSVDTKTKLFNLQNSIRNQIKNAHFLRNITTKKGLDENLDSQQNPVLNVNDENKNNQENYTHLDMRSSIASTKNWEVNENTRNHHQNPCKNIENQPGVKDNKSNDSDGTNNIPNRNSEAKQTNCKELCSLINKAENFRFDQEVKILTLRTENADCINKKIKPRKIDTFNAQSEIRTVALKTAQKIKSKEEKIRHINNHHINNLLHHHHHKHDTIKVDGIDASLRRSERIRVRKHKKRLKSCLISNVKKSKQNKLINVIPMSLVDQFSNLKREHVGEQHPKQTKEYIDETSDLITYKNCSIEEMTIRGQQIKKLSSISEHWVYGTKLKQNSQLKSVKCSGMDDCTITKSADVKTDTSDARSNISKVLCTEDSKDQRILTEKKEISLKSRYPALEALIASTSNEVKPIIRKRKRVKFDKSKYEKIKKTNKEKENNTEQNKVLLLNLNKNNQSKGMQSLLLIRDQNNKTHLLFTKPIGKDKINLMTNGNITIEDDKMKKVNENNPNYINNKKMEKMREERVQQTNIQKANVKIIGSNMIISGDPLLTAPNLMNDDAVGVADDKEIDLSKKVKDNGGLSFHTEYSHSVNFEKKLDTSGLTPMNHMGRVDSVMNNKAMTPQMLSMETDKSMNTMDVMTTELSSDNYSCRSETYNDYEFYSISPEYNVSYEQNMISNATKIFQHENNCSTQFLQKQKFYDENADTLYYNQNPSLPEKTDSLRSSMLNKRVENSISNRFMKSVDIIDQNGAVSSTGEVSYESKLCKANFEINKNFPKKNVSSNSLDTSQRASTWGQKSVPYENGIGFHDNLNDAHIGNLSKPYKVTDTNHISPNSQYTKNLHLLKMDTFQPSNCTYTYNQSRPFEHEMVPNLSTQTYSGENVMNISAMKGFGESNSTRTEMKSYAPDGHSNVKLNFSHNEMVQIPRELKNFGPLSGTEEVCWNNANGSDWNEGKFEQNLQMASCSGDNFDEHLQLSEEIMKESLQEDQEVTLIYKIRILCCEFTVQLFCTYLFHQFHSH